VAAKKVKRERGIYEKVHGTGIWWVRWTDGQSKLRRELAGTSGNARKRLAERRAEKMRGKAPVLRRQADICESWKSNIGNEIEMTSERIIVATPLVAVLVAVSSVHTCCALHSIAATLPGATIDST
jgi:hypothetical protein